MKNKANINTDSEDFSIEMNRGHTALVIDGDVVSGQAICEMLSMRGYESVACDSIRSAKEVLSSQSLIILSLHQDDPELQPFIEQISEGSGHHQRPYVIALNYKNRTEMISGIDQVMNVPIDEEDFLLGLDDAGTVISERSQKVTGNWNSRNVMKGQSISRDAGAGNGQPEDQVPIIVRRGTGEAVSQKVSGRVPGNHLRPMVDACPLAMAMFDRNMNYLFSNDSWNDSIGNAVLDSSGVGQFEFIPRVSNEWRSLCNDCFKYGTEQIGEELIQWASGDKEWVRWFVNPWHSEDTSFGGLVISAQSINAEKKLEIESRFEADVAESVMTSPMIPVLFLDLKGRIVRSNRAAKKMAHWDPIGDEGKYYWEVFLDESDHDASREQFLMFSQKMMNAGQFTFPDTTVDQIVDGEGSQRSVIWTNSPRRSSDGSVIGIIRVGTDSGLFTDLSERNVGESDFLEMFPVPAWKCDCDGSVHSINDALMALIGFERSEDMNLIFYEGMNDSDAQNLADLIRSSVTSRVSFSEVFKVRDSNGNERAMRFCSEPDKDDIERAVYGFAYDVSAENELGILKSQSARLESDLVATGVELKSAKEEIADLRSSSAKARSISDSLPLGILLLGRDGKIIYANEAASQTVGTDLSSFEMIEDWLTHSLLGNDQLGLKELLERWRSLVWVKGSAGIFAIKTDSQESLHLEFRPRLMNDGGLLIALSEVAGPMVNDKSVKDDRGSSSEMGRRMDVLLSIVSDILRLWGKDQDAETLNVTVSRIDALTLLLTHSTGEEHFSSVNFGKYTSSLIRELIELSPDHSDPCVQLNYGIQSNEDSLGGNIKIERKDIFIPYSLAMPLALICNEILRDIFVNACTERDEVMINCSVIISDDGKSGELLLSHNGVPVSSQYELSEGAWDGLEIVQSLARRIGGRLDVSCGLLTEFHVEFCFQESR